MSLFDRIIEYLAPPRSTGNGEDFLHIHNAYYELLRHTPSEIGMILRREEASMDPGFRRRWQSLKEEIKSDREYRRLLQYDESAEQESYLSLFALSILKRNPNFSMPFIQIELIS